MATTAKPKITMDTIKQCAPIIRQCINRDCLYPYLLQCSLLTTDEMYHFTSKDKSPSESANYLIETLETKGSDSAQKFYLCLQEETEHIGHSEIVEHLRTTALQDTSSKSNAQAIPSEKEKNLVKPEELKAIVNGKSIEDVTSDSIEAKMCRQNTQILLVTANEFEQYAALSLLEPMEGRAVLYRFQHNYSSLAKVATYTFGKFGSFNAAVQRMTTQGPASAQDVITIAADCFGHNLNAIFAVGVACGVKKKNDMLDVLVSKRVTFYTIARYGTNKQGKPEIINREIANLPTSDFLLQNFTNPPDWPTESNKTAARLSKKPKKHMGLLLSGDYLVDNKEFKDELLNIFAKEAIGIEMEGAGLYHDYRSHNYEILIVKAVCDFGDGKKDKEYQPTAALLAAECLHHYLNNKVMPKGLRDFYNRKGNAPFGQPFVSYPSLTGDNNWERDGKERQIQQPQQQDEQAKNQSEDDVEPDSGRKRREPADVAHPELNVGIKKPTGTNRQLQHQQDLHQAKSTHQPQVREFSVDDIEAATGNFSTILGKGGFGTVYQGDYKGTKVAIKKLTENATLHFSQFEEGEVPQKYTATGQLRCEMWALTRCRHKNLVDLMGFCKNPPFLVHELMEEGNLYDRLHNKEPVLTIHQRSQMLKDVCRGLSWLHSMEPPMMHGDVKTRNILLDKDLTAKLADFGFTREIPRVVGDRTMITATVVAKSMGYCPPEMDTAHISCKSDMYCYGVVALEMFTRKPAFCKDWEDPKLVEYLDDQRKSGIEGYKGMYDQSAGPISDNLLLIYNKLIESCLLKHSRRCTSAQAMEWWSETSD